MKSLSHIEKSVMGEKVYSSDGEKLYVSFKNFGKPQNFTFVLKKISPNYEVRYGVFFMAWLVPLVILVVFSVIFIFVDQVVDLGIFRFVLAIPSLPIIWRVILGSRSQKIVQFFCGSSSPAFDVIVSGKKDQEFIEELVAAVQSQKGSQKGTNAKYKD